MSTFDEYYDRSAHIFKDQLLSLGADGDTLTQTFDPSADQWCLTYRSHDRSVVYEHWYQTPPTYDTVMVMSKQCRMNAAAAVTAKGMLERNRAAAQQYRNCDAWMYDLG